jgi:RNA-binding protein Nova
MAIDMVFAKILEDPLSASCPNISYIDFKGPVASSNPTGSPFAGPPGHPGHHRMDMGGGGHGVFGNIGNSMNNLNLNSGANNGGMGGHNGGPVETLKSTLRGSGYSEQAVEEISHAMYTLANYGFLGLGLGLGGLNIGGGGLGGGGLGGNLTLANLAGILAGNPPHQQAGPPQNNSLLGSGGGGGGSGPNSGGGSGGGAGVANGDTKSSVFGPVGSTTTTMAGGDTGEGSGSYFGSPSMNGGEQFSGAGGDSMFGNSFNNGNGAGFQGGNNGFTGQNQNSFGLGTGMGSFPSGGMNNGGGEIEKKDVDVGEHIVGAILGPGGRGIVELQKLTGANIQISKKGVYSPGTRNRIVTLNGNSTAIQRAQYMIQQRIAQEEAKRAQNRSQQQQPPH